MNQPRPFLPVALKGQKLTQKRALVNRKDPFSNENSIKYGPYGSIRNRKSNGSLKISKLISPRTTLRYNHAAVVVLDKIIIIGGKGNAYTGEIVKGKVGTRKKTST